MISDAAPFALWRGAGGQRDGGRTVTDRTNDRPRVVIVGGGFGGLWAARALHDAPVNVTLIDRRNHHLFRGHFRTGVRHGD